MAVKRHFDPLSDAAARQAALRGATLLVLVSIVMAGAPLERGGAAAVATASTHREARLVSGGEPAQADAARESGDEVSGAAAGAGWSFAIDSRVPAREWTVRENAGTVRAPVRVALLDLPPPVM